MNTNELPAYAEAGTYHFSVFYAENKISSKNNPMIEIKLCLYKDGKRVGSYVQAFLLQKMPDKLKGFCLATGLKDKYESGSLDASDCMGRQGRVVVAVEEKKPYKTKNVVVEYLSCGDSPMPVIGRQEETGEIDEPLPF